MATVTADPLGVLIAFGAGIVSFLSPCVLPLVPGYLSMVSGLSAAEIEGDRRNHPRLMGTVVLFVLGFTVIFIGLGAVASSFGQLLHSHRSALQDAAGALVVAMGVLLGILSLPASIWQRLGGRTAGSVAWIFKERRAPIRARGFGLFMAPVMGMAFALAWTPCIGPVLGAVLGLAADKATVTGGIVLLAFYSFGLGVPFILFGLGAGKFVAKSARFRWFLGFLQGVGGVILILFGVLLLSGHLSWLSTQFSHLLNRIGLHRLTTSL